MLDAKSASQIPVNVQPRDPEPKVRDQMAWIENKIRQEAAKGNKFIQAQMTVFDSAGPYSEDHDPAQPWIGGLKPSELLVHRLRASGYEVFVFPDRILSSMTTNLRSISPTAGKHHVTQHTYSIKLSISW